MATIKNPILPGFNPDPSFCRVGDDYYIATSTFEWFPGVQIHHSKDLVNWKLITHPLSTVEHLDMRGVDNSDGIWAPCLNYADGKFWLVFTNVQQCRGFTWMSTPNYVTSAENIEGPWSKPVYVNSTGFDPSLFHDDDGKKYIVNMIWDGRTGTNNFAGINIQEFDTKKMALVGEREKVFTGTHLSGTEGPFILKKDGYYYLVTAEGGTNWSHAVTVCRSKTIFGPYEVHPENPVLTSRLNEDAPLQRTGHGFFVETQNGEWYLSHLCGRPVKNPEGYQYNDKYASGFSILGRETALQKVIWREDWPYLANGTRAGELEVEAPNLPAHPWPEAKLREEFNGDTIDIQFQTLREPLEESWASLTSNPGKLRMHGRQFFHSRMEQSMLMRRIQHHTCEAETCMEFDATEIQEMAGLVVYYNRSNFYFLRVTANDQGKKVIGIIQMIMGGYAEVSEDIEIPTSGSIYLKVALDIQYYQFSYSSDGKNWTPIGPKLNSTSLSDEFGNEVFRFTGTFVGMGVIDITGMKKAADFDYFEYRPLETKDTTLGFGR